MSNNAIPREAHCLHSLEGADEERQDRNLLAAQARTLEEPADRLDVLGWRGELELKGADEGEDQRLESVRASRVRPSSEVGKMTEMRTRRGRSGSRYRRGCRRET